MEDSPLGVRSTDFNTAFPAGITTGATFDPSLMYARGSAIGAEARGKGENMILGPCVGPLGKLPLGGRNWEGFGADPYLQGVGAYETVTVSPSWSFISERAGHPRQWCHRHD